MKQREGTPVAVSQEDLSAVFIFGSITSFICI
jgi:hypothetical protein